MCVCVSSSVVCLIAVKFTDVLININLSQKQTETEVQRLSLQVGISKIRKAVLMHLLLSRNPD